MRVLFFLLISLLSTTLVAQDSVQFEKLFVENEGKGLSALFNKSIDIDIPEAKATYDKKQATVIINNFFKKTHPISYLSNHKGGGNNRANYEIGLLATETKKYRTYLLYNYKEEKVQIIELRIELED